MGGSRWESLDGDKDRNETIDGEGVVWTGEGRQRGGEGECGQERADRGNSRRQSLHGGSVDGEPKKGRGRCGH